MSDLEDLDEAEIERQLAELGGSDIDSDDLEGLSDLEDDEYDDVAPAGDEFPAFDEEAKALEVDEEVAALVDGKTGPALAQALRTKLVTVLMKKDVILQQVDTKEEEYFTLKEQTVNRKDPKLLGLEQKVDKLNDLLEEEERESANMYTIFKRAEKELVSLREEHSKLQKLHEQRQTQQTQTLGKMRESMSQSMEQCTEHKKSLTKKIYDLSDSIESTTEERNNLLTENRRMELRMEELLQQRTEKKSLVANVSQDVSAHLSSNEQELKDLRAKLEKLTADTEALGVASKAAKDASDEKAKEHRAINRKHGTLALEHDDAERQVQRFDRDAARQDKQVERLESDIAELRAQRKEVLKKLAAA